MNIDRRQLLHAFTNNRPKPIAHSQTIALCITVLVANILMMAAVNLAAVSGAEAAPPGGDDSQPLATGTLESKANDPAAAQPIIAPAAQPVRDFTLPTATGETWSLASQKSRLTVLAFLSIDCPMSNSYLPVLTDLAKQYPNHNVSFVAVAPLTSDTAEKIRAHNAEFAFGWPVLIDVDQVAVRAVGAVTMPEVFVLDAARILKYRGRIDDGFAARMKQRPNITRADLKTAIDELLAGKEVSLPVTTAFGCPIPELEGDTTTHSPEMPDSPESPVSTPIAPDATTDAAPASHPITKTAATVTWSQDIAALLQKNCQSCHRPGQVGPFSLLTYADAVRWAELCDEEIAAGRMPPWKPESNPLLSAGRSLTADEKQLFRNWVAQGTAEGDPQHAPSAVVFNDTWTLGEPDLILEVPSDITIGSTGRDHFRVVVLPTNLPEDKYITAMEVRPGNPRVVHHTLQLIDTTGKARKLQAAAARNPDQNSEDHGPGYGVAMGWGFLPDRANMIGGWAPGLLPKTLPDGVGQLLPAGADVCIQFHFHRTGKQETDRTQVGLYFADKPVTQRFRSLPTGALFMNIPAGKSRHRVSTTWQLNEDVTVYRATPHMHLLGREISATYERPGESEKSLIRIPEWDYQWQEQYDLESPLNLPKGTRIRVTGYYDNSAENPLNPFSPPQAVRLGEQTTNEMCFVFLGVSTSSKASMLMSPVIFDRSAIKPKQLRRLRAK